jgi:release factor glutamine methyltransferase
VFVPRPETEVLVEVVLGAVAPIDAPIVVDTCTGSGAVALAIADEHPGAQVYATDSSQDAVSLARANAERLGLAITVAVGDLVSSLPEELEDRTDAICANPPYVPASRRDTLPAEVLADPEAAVFGDRAIYERLFADAHRWLRHGGTVAVEIEDAAGPSISAAATAAGFTGVAVHPDLTGRDRVVSGRRP